MAINALKIAKFCKPFRIVLGLALVGYAIYSGNNWFYLGLLPLIAGLVGFCPACLATGQCTATGKAK
ncbi:MAG: DUF2892 domain-containing protein [Sulfurovum sp.]|nr:DUF2892 domain-containing protein [Sulfurovum sp.]